MILIKSLKKSFGSVLILQILLNKRELLINDGNFTPYLGGFAPLFNGTFLVVIGATQGQSLSAINKKIRAEYKDVMIANWKVNN